MTQETYPDTPDEVYVSTANYKRIDVKATTACRLIGWLREYAEYCDVSGATKTGEHARHMANQFAAQIDGEDVVDE